MPRLYERDWEIRLRSGKERRKREERVGWDVVRRSSSSSSSPLVRSRGGVLSAGPFRDEDRCTFVHFQRQRVPTRMNVSFPFLFPCPIPIPFNLTKDTPAGLTAYVRSLIFIFTLHLPLTDDIHSEIYKLW